MRRVLSGALVSALVCLLAAGAASGSLSSLRSLRQSSGAWTARRLGSGEIFTL